MKRGSSGLCLVVGVDKPTGITSHDVVNRCRRIFGEKRVGHTGTLDPMASGVMAVCVGPATRLDAYLTDQTKGYRATISFGVATDTDDAEGTPIRVAPIPSQVSDAAYAAEILESFVGPSKQLPPAYSAIKVGGVKACDAARKGRIIDLSPRDIEVFEANLAGISEGDGEAPATWDVEFLVSKGTYVRSLARDIGKAVGSEAHLSALRRTRSGNLGIDRCVSLETLEEIGVRAALDPVALLGFRILFASKEFEAKASHGNPIPSDGVALFSMASGSWGERSCACMPGICESPLPPKDGEIVSVVAGNLLAALYRYDGASGKFVSQCVFSQGVTRDGDFLP